MELRTVPNPQRGCGRLKEGGFYARGDSAPGGTLGAWSWTLGEHVIGGRNLTISVPARQMTVIRLSATLHTRRLMTEAVMLPDDSPLTKLPPFAVIDHVGSEFYTPYSFARECVECGPSRRIPANVAKAIAPYTPIPIVFTHSWLPITDAGTVNDLLAWADPRLIGDDNLHFSPTYERPSWGIRKGDYYGGDHWIIPVLRRMHEASGEQEVHLTKLMPTEIVEQTLTAEQIFGISWLTRVIRVVTGEEDDAELENLLKSGIEPVIAEAVER